MPSNWLSIDSNFPSFTGEETPEQQIRELHNYLFQLREGLQYSLQNLTTDNFNTAALKNMTDAQKNEVISQLEKVYTQINQMSTEIDRLSSRVSGTENLSGRVTTAEGEITSLKNRMKKAESDIGSMEERFTITEGNAEDLAGRVKQLEDDQTLDNLQKAVTGEGGLQEQMDTANKEMKKISGAVQVADDGSATVGSEGKVLRLVGQVYINGVLIEQGGAT